MSYIYKFIDDNDSVIYVGKATSIQSRIGSHNHLPNECYESVKKVEYAKVSESDVLIYEPYYINIHNPTFNTSMKTGMLPSVRLKALKFRQYNGAYSRKFTKFTNSCKKINKTEPTNKLYDFEFLKPYADNHLYGHNIICSVGYGVRKTDGSRIYRYTDLPICDDCDVLVEKYVNKNLYRFCTLSITPRNYRFSGTFEIRDIDRINNVDVSQLPVIEKIKILKGLIIRYKAVINKRCTATMKSVIATRGSDWFEVNIA